MEEGPTIHHRRLAASLRELRESREWTMEEAAEESGISTSTISRMERAEGRVNLPFVTTLLRVYSVADDQFEELVSLAKAAKQKGWWQDYRDVLDDDLVKYFGLESGASEERIYDAMVVPGLFQTREYAQAVFKSHFFDHPPMDVDRRVEVRIQRQMRLSDIEVWAVIDEPAIRRPYGGREVHLGQLAHLIEVAEMPGVTLQVVPQQAARHPGVDGSFSILGFRSAKSVALVESQAGYVWIDEEKRVRRLIRLFDRLVATAMDPQMSVDSIGMMMEKA